MEFKGTKGKWEVGKHIKTIVYSLDKQFDANIFELNISSQNKIANQSELEANALLISKAPDMLKMLQSVLELQRENYGNGMNTHLAMIDKAKEIEQLIKEAT